MARGFFVSASSAGIAESVHPDRFNAEMRVNGTRMQYEQGEWPAKWSANLHPTGGGRGWNVMTVSPTGELLSLKSDDIGANGRESPDWRPADGTVVDKLTRDLESLADGTIVCASIKDEGCCNRTQRLREALESIGARRFRELERAGSYAIIGVKNGKAVEELHLNGQKAVISQTQSELQQLQSARAREDAINWIQQQDQLLCSDGFALSPLPHNGDTWFRHKYIRHHHIDHHYIGLYSYGPGRISAVAKVFLFLP